MEDVAGRLLLTSSKTNSLAAFPVPQNNFATEILNKLTSLFKSFFGSSKQPVNSSTLDSISLTKILVGAGILAVVGLGFWFWKNKSTEVEKLVDEGQQLLGENKRLWKENQMVNEENQHVRERVDSLEHNVWEMMELILNMKNPKNKDDKEKVERHLTILKQCFEDRLSELRRENKLLRERAKELHEERICSICLENKLDRSIVPCGHSICHCCERSVLERNTCPFCRATIKSVIPRF